MKRNPKDLRVRVVNSMSHSREKARILGKTITVTRDSTKADRLHEEGHYVLGHNTSKLPKTPESYAREEVDASLYAHRKGKTPSHVKQQLRAIFNDITIHEYKTTPHKAAISLDRAIKRKEVPQAWKDDWKELRGDAKRAYGKL
jgi:hypothetical protein